MKVKPFLLPPNINSNKQSLIFFICFCLYVISFLAAKAQVSISGQVINSADKKGIPDASVFFNNGSIGTKTDPFGNFIIPKIRPGKYELVVSVIGFETFHFELNVNNMPVDLGSIAVKAKTMALKEVRINSGSGNYFDRNLEWFKQGFLGNSELSKECKIVNPEILDFIYYAKSDSLTASTDDFLIIENNALGYRLKYLVEDFEMFEKGRRVHYNGSVLFEPMKGGPGQMRRWINYRKETYEGSQMHFLRSLLANNFQQEGFMVLQYAIYANPARPADSLINAKIAQFKGKSNSFLHKEGDSLLYWTKKKRLPKTQYLLNSYPLNTEELLKLTTQKGLYALSCDYDGLFIMYNKRHIFPSHPSLDVLESRYNENNTLVNFTLPYAFFDSTGWLNNPNSITLSGAWGTYRVAGLLPTDYDPGEK